MMLHLGAVFPDEYIAVLVPVHIALGALATFVLAPWAFLAPKRGSMHRRVGSWMVYVSLLIAITGMLLLVDPLFELVYWKERQAQAGYLTIFESAHYPELLFMYLAVVTAYLAVTASRLWPRIGYGHSERIAGGWVDWLMAALAVVFGGGYMALGVYDMIYAQRFGLHFIAGGLVMVAFGCFDIYTLVVRPLVKSFPWWALHFAKFLYLWIGLAVAFWLRLTPAAMKAHSSDSLTLLQIWFLICVVLYWWYRPAMKAMLAQRAMKSG